jgi:hypothetical protein
LGVKPNTTFPASGGIVGATCWLKLRDRTGKGAGAETVTGGLDLASRAENNINRDRRCILLCLDYMFSDSRSPPVFFRLFHKPGTKRV